MLLIWETLFAFGRFEMLFQNQVKFCARMREGNVGARELEERGFMYVGKALTREQTENALSAVDRAFAAEGQGYSRINSNREQVKLGRRMHQMVPALQEAVAVLEGGDGGLTATTG